MNSIDLSHTIVNFLNDNKALDITALDVQNLTKITDYMIICSATSKRHAVAMASKLIETMKQSDIPILGTEGDREAEWILVDLENVIVHIMLPEVRDFYELEKLWGMNQRSADLNEN